MTKQVLDKFKIVDGKKFLLVKTDREEYQIIRNRIVYHTDNLLEPIMQKFYKIKEMFRLEHELVI